VRAPGGPWGRLASRARCPTPRGKLPSEVPPGAALCSLQKGQRCEEEEEEEEVGERVSAASEPSRR